MIKCVRRLNYKCDCGKRADFSVEYTNDDLPKGYVRQGTRILEYCTNCLPKEAECMWVSELEGGL